jgi:hypothetical protein
LSGWIEAVFADTWLDNVQDDDSPAMFHPLDAKGRHIFPDIGYQWIFIRIETQKSG